AAVSGATLWLSCPSESYCTFFSVIHLLFITRLNVQLLILLLASKLPSADLCPPAGPACPDGWIGYRGKCYDFSEVEGNWTYVQSHCSSFGASLAGIDSEQEMVSDSLIAIHWPWHSSCCCRTWALPLQGPYCLCVITGIAHSQLPPPQIGRQPLSR
uniref:C-type lectin domain-containing protein n=1 Tax=Terrapene triunguis TaxID=2587831 RepID=A0A674J225_9SAUR